jgi:hypothetical protein
MVGVGEGGRRSSEKERGGRGKRRRRGKVEII